ncbi:GldG family protein [bacterium]|nr:GldG family protein [bacterium]
MKVLNNKFTTTFVAGTLLLAGCAVLINMVFNNFHGGRFDLTGDRIYTMSPSVTKILSKLEAPIEVTYYVSSSEKMPTQWKNLERDVIDKLRELKLASRGKFNYKVFDPSKEEEKEAYQEDVQKEKEAKGLFAKKPKKVQRQKIAERLYEKGVIPIGVRSTSRDEIAVKRVYSSIVLSYLDRKEDVISEVRPENFGNLEYEIISRVYKLISRKKPGIAFYPGKPEAPQQMYRYYGQTPPDMYSNAVKLLKKAGYNVTRTNITEKDQIPDDISTMVLMLDQPLNVRQMFEIDKLVHKGVHIIMAGQQYNYRIYPSRTRPGKFEITGMSTGLNISDLTKSYGIELGSNMFMDENSAYIQIPVYQTRNMGGLQFREQRMEPVRKPVIIKINPENINRDLSISNNIDGLFFMYGSRILLDEKKIKEDSLFEKVLFTSSKYSWTGTGRGWGPVNTNPPQRGSFLGKQPLGVYIKGKFKAKYLNQDVPPWKASSDKNNNDTASVQEKITGEAVPTQIIAIGCSNMFKNDVMQYIDSHQKFLVNCVDALTLGDELINIRAKNVTPRRIREISSVGKAAAKAFVLLFTPLLFIAAGIYLTIRRKRRAYNN